MSIKHDEKQQLCPCCKGVMRLATLTTLDGAIDCDHYMCDSCDLSVRADAWDNRATSKVKKVFGDYLGRNVSDFDTFDYLCLDSLDRIEILMDIEEKFDIEAGDSEAKLWKTVGDVMKYFERKN